MAVISMKQLLEAGVHFGHQTRRWNPKMAQYIFTERNGIYIIDLQKTVRKIDDAYMFVRDIAIEGKTVLFVGTKKQAQESIESEAKRCGMYFVNNRWLGGTLTNFRTIQTRIKRLNEIDGIDVKAPKGAFYIFPSYDRKIKSADLAMECVRAGLICTPGTAFGEEGEHHLRFSYAANEDKIDKGMDILEKVMKKVK